MGCIETTVRDCGFLTVVREIHTRHIMGNCPMCGTEINEIFDLSDSNHYECPCGYFWLESDMEKVFEDNNGVRTEQWKDRLAAALAKQGKPKQNEGRRYPVVKEYCPKARRCVVRAECYGGTWDVLQDLVGEVKKDFPELQDNQIVVVKFGGTAYKQTYGIEFQVSVDKTPEGYRNVHRLEVTL